MLWFYSSQGLSPQPSNYQVHAQPSSQFMFLSNSYLSMILSYYYSHTLFSIILASTIPHHDHLEKDWSYVPTKKAKQWKQVNFQFCDLLWQSMEPSLLVSLRAFKTCHSILKKAQTIYTDDIQHLYDSANRLASLKMTNHDMVSFMTKAQSTMEDSCGSS